MSLLPFCEWLARTAWSIALHESLYVYPLVETAHVLALLLFVGIVSFVDLRLLGWVFRDVPVSDVVARLIPWAVGGFVVIATTGALLFYAIPVRTYLSIFFRIKVLVLVAAGINTAVLHRALDGGAVPWNADTRPPFGARLAGALSLLSWATVIVMGRMIAYNWFDCDRQPQSDFINWAAGCPLDGPG
jgi:hypothetical protein